MDLTRTADHIQSRPLFLNQNTAPRDLNKPITHLSEVKGSAQPRGQANATDTLPPSLIARMTKGVIVTQRHQIANQPASSRDTRIAEHYKASYVLEARGGATAPGAALSLRPTGKAAGGMENYSTARLRQMLERCEDEIMDALSKASRYEDLAESSGEADAREHLAEARRQRAKASASRAQKNAVENELGRRERG